MSPTFPYPYSSEKHLDEKDLAKNNCKYYYGNNAKWMVCASVHQYHGKIHPTEMLNSWNNFRDAINFHPLLWAMMLGKMIWWPKYCCFTWMIYEQKQDIFLILGYHKKNITYLCAGFYYFFFGFIDIFWATQNCVHKIVGHASLK